MHALPGFDEYLLGYQDRSDALPAEHANRIVPGGNGIFYPVIVARGQVVGTWRRTIGKAGVSVTAEPFDRLTARDAAGFSRAINAFAHFVGLPAADAA